MKRKVKICMNLQCNSRVNAGNVTVCTGCGMELRDGLRFLDENEIEQILHPENDAQKREEEAASPEEEHPSVPQEIVVCPECGERIPYRVGLEFCPNCEEYVQDVIPIREDEEAAVQDESVCSMQQEAQTSGVTALRSIDGAYHLELSGEWIKLGRTATGQEYFTQYGKRKVCREHAILSKKNGEWFISYCKREERNYVGGVENPIFINQRAMGRDEMYQLQAGDRIGLAESDTSDGMAAFFDVE